MPEMLPSWLLERYKKLWGKFRKKEFNHKDASQTLEEEEALVSVFLSELRKKGWLTIKLDPKDSRRRIYQLEDPIKIMREIMGVEGNDEVEISTK